MINISIVINYLYNSNSNSNSNINNQYVENMAVQRDYYEVLGIDKNADLTRIIHEYYDISLAL